MPIFISYSHKDKDFVDTLATQLVRNKVHVWLDRWELNIGDSLISKIQEAITGASALLVILSKASVASEWCKKELNAALVRELEEKRVVVLPVLVEDCDIPLFLRDKMHADFRRDVDYGLKIILEAVAKISNEYLGRFDSPEFHIDWAIDWQMKNNLFQLRITIVEQAANQPYTSLSTVNILCDAEATKAYMTLNNQGMGDFARRKIVGLLAAGIEKGLDLTMLLEDQFEKRRVFEIKGKGKEPSYIIELLARRLGEDTGRDIVLHLDNQILQIFQYMNEVSKGLPGKQA